MLRIHFNLFMYEPTQNQANKTTCILIDCLESYRTLAINEIFRSRNRLNKFHIAINRWNCKKPIWLVSSIASVFPILVDIWWDTIKSHSRITMCCASGIIIRTTRREHHGVSNHRISIVCSIAFRGKQRKCHQRSTLLVREGNHQ